MVLLKSSKRNIAAAACLCALMLLGALGGCARWDAGAARKGIADDLAQRTGHGLRADAAPGINELPPGIDIDDGVTEDEAVAIALWNNAAFQAVLADLGLARADIIQAGLLSNPVLSVLFPRGPRQYEAALTMPVEALWLRPKRLDVAQVRARNVGQRLTQSGLDLVRDVRVAYANLALAQDRERLGAESAALRSRIAELSQKRLQAGDVSEFEVTATRIDAARAQTEIASLKRGIELARHRIANLLGLGRDDLKLAAGGGRERPAREDNPDDLVRDALAARPDLRAAELAAESASKQVGLSRWEAFKLDAFFDGDTIADRFEIGYGFKLPLPLFHRNQDAIARGRAELERARHQEAAVHDRIVMEVRDAHTQYLQARDDLDAQQTKILPALEAAATQADKAYEAGDISYLQALETTRQLLDARLKIIDSSAALRRARAELERSVGMRLDGRGTPVNVERESKP